MTGTIVTVSGLYAGLKSNKFFCILTFGHSVVDEVQEGLDKSMVPGFRVFLCFLLTPESST